MREKGSVRKAVLIFMLVIFVIDSTIFGWLTAGKMILKSAGVFKTEISFTEDITYVDPVEYVDAEIIKYLGPEDGSAVIEPVILEKDKTYELVLSIPSFDGWDRSSYLRRSTIKLDNGKELRLDLEDDLSKWQEIYDKDLDVTYVVAVPACKVNSYEDLLSEFDRAVNDFKAAQIRKAVIITGIITACAILLSVLSFRFYKFLLYCDKNNIATGVTAAITILNVVFTMLVLLMLYVYQASF